MIDTIAAWFLTMENKPGDTWQDDGWEVDTKQRRGKSGVHRARTIYFRDSGLARFTLSPDFSPNAWMLGIETSLPKLLRGHNVDVLTLEEHTTALRALETHATDVLYWENVPPVGEWRVSRADWCWTWEVGAPATYVAALEGAARVGTAQILHSYRQARGGATLSVGPRGGAWRSTLYDKEAEVMSALRAGAVDLIRCGMTAEQLIERARGMLRFEVTARRNTLARVLGPQATVSDLNAHLAAKGLDFLSRRWEELSGDWRPMPYEEAVGRLRGYYSPAKACRLADKWFHVTHLGADGYRTAFGLDTQSWRRFRSDLAAAGVGFGEAEITPLVVGKPFQMACGA